MKLFVQFRHLAHEKQDSAADVDSDSPNKIFQTRFLNQTKVSFPLGAGDFGERQLEVVV